MNKLLANSQNVENEAENLFVIFSTNFQSLGRGQFPPPSTMVEFQTTMSSIDVLLLKTFSNFQTNFHTNFKTNYQNGGAKCL